MKKILSILTLVYALITLGACTAFKKEIKQPVKIAFNDRDFQPTLSSTAIYTKYTQNISAQQIVSAFLKGFDSEASITKNVTIINSEDEADFILKFKSININESTTIQTINDPKSPYNGEQVSLNSVQCSATFELIKTKDKTGKKVGSSGKHMNCSNSKLRSEKLKNTRDLGDVIKGTNKDHTIYHTKLLSDDIGIRLSEDVGRRIWVPITKKIAKNL